MKVVVTAGDGSDDQREIRLTIFSSIILGRGACGRVVAGKVDETGEVVAVKTVKTTQFQRMQLPEIRYLKTLKHINIIKLLYHYRTIKYPDTFANIIMERMPERLWDIYAENPYVTPMFEIRLYMYQLLRAVAYMHNQGICHRDIKPGNVLIDSEIGVLKLCDFGFACDLSLRATHSTHVGTLQYQAPELLLEFTNYTESIDVWGIGCIFVEILKRNRPLFSRGSDRVHQLLAMIELFGTPNAHQFENMGPSYPFIGLPQIRAKPWLEILAPFPVRSDVVSLCRRLLCYSPSTRISPHEALAHKFFDELRLPESRFLSNGNPLPPLFNFQPGEFPGGFDHLIPPYLKRTKEQEKAD